MLSTNLQNPIDFNGQKFYVGLDVHKKSWAVTIRSLGIEIARFTQPPCSRKQFSLPQAPPLPQAIFRCRKPPGLWPTC
jgi:hypothetical protein